MRSYSSSSNLARTFTSIQPHSSPTRKTFQHRLVEQLDIRNEDTPDGRYYITPSGLRLPSVTTVLGRRLDNSWLAEWKARVGEVEARRVSEAAARRGTVVHDIAERYVRNEVDYSSRAMPNHLYSFKPIQKVLDERVDQIYGIEIPLYSAALNTAGRTDLVAEYDGVLSIIDYKTSKRTKALGDIKGYMLQSTAYSMMFEKMYGIPVPQIVIVMTVDHESEALVFARNRSEYVAEALSVFADA